MSDTTKAIFLSYASNDAEAARRICEALRAAGLEVWFDRNELRGGDAWDASIRKQIKECTLFVPIISASTNARSEGYFRLEWKLAVDRSHLMADDQPFLFPVLIDDSPEAAARVPDRFRERQWSRLIDANSIEAFAGLIRQLFSGVSPPGTTPETLRTKHVDTRRENDTPSIAVMAFANRSNDPDDEYFSDGLADELLTVLAKIHGLQVAARTSSFQFKGKNEDISVIGRKLNVATVLEGSVRKSGNRVRISVQLVKVADGFHLWSETYDRTLEDIFAVQDEIALAVVGELRARLLGAPADAKAETAKVAAEVQEATKGRSDNPEAFRLYLEGQFLRVHLTRESAARAVECYEAALRLDPDFALGWAGLARAVSDQIGQNWAARDEGFAKATRAAERALELEPNLAEGYIARGWILRAWEWDWAGAEVAFKRALELAPGNAMAMNAAALLTGNQGKLDEAIGLFRQAIGLDPLNVALNRNLGLYCLAKDAFEDARAALDVTLGLSAQGGLTRTWRALVWLAMGKPDEALADAGQETSEIFRMVAVAVVRFARGERDLSDAALNELITRNGADSPYQVAEVFGARGEADNAFEWLERTLACRDPGISYLKIDPFLKGLHHDVRWKPLLEKMNMELRRRHDPPAGQTERRGARNRNDIFMLRRDLGQSQ